MGRERLMGYALDYVSFLFSGLTSDDVNSIDSIILFGSIARGDFDESSDVDIFINVIKNQDKVERSVRKLTKEFYESVKFEKYWKLLGVDRNIKFIVGKLEKWTDLKESIILNGITLYRKFKESPTKNRHMVMLQWNSITDDSRRILLNKRLFGYRQKGKKYKGIVEIINGEKLGPTCILIPTEHYRKILKIFRQMDIDVSIRDVLM